MAFKLVKSNAEAADTEEWDYSGISVQEGDLLELDAGATLATVADTSTQRWQRCAVVKGIPLIGGASSSAVTVIPVNTNQIWEVLTTYNSNRAHDGDDMVLTDTRTVNNSGTHNETREAIVHQIAPSGAAGDKKILVRFIDASGGTAISG